MARRLLPLFVTFCLLITGAAMTSPSAAAQSPPTPSNLPANLEGLADYVPAVSCDPRVKAGSAALGRLLVSTYHGTSYHSAYNCGTDGTVSEHYEGRAVDWMASVRNRTQAAQAKALLTWLFASDRFGHRFANARRLGVMYIVFNNRIWGAWDGAWHPHSSCATHPQTSWDGTCHRNHMHISLSWEGAQKRTSFWTRRVAAPDYGPCRSSDLNWALPYAHANPRPCHRYATVRAPARSSTTMQALVKYSGAYLQYGASGPAVTAVQRALRVSATGSFGSATRAAVQRWQKARGYHVSGVIGPTTWRSLLKAYAPK